MGVWEAITGNFMAFGLAFALGIPCVIALFAPLNEIFSKIFEKVPLIGCCITPICGLFGKWMQPVVAFFLMAAAFGMALLSGFGAFAIIMTVLIWGLAIAGVFMKKLPPHEFKFIVPWAGEGYNSVWMLIVEFLFFFQMMALYPIGTALGIIVLIILVVLVLIVAVVFGGPVLAPVMAASGAAAGAGGGAAVAGMGEAGALARVAGSGGEAMQGLGNLAKTGQSTLDQVGNNVTKMFGGKVPGVGGGGAAPEMDNMLSQFQQQAENTINTQKNAIQTRIDDLVKQLSNAKTPEGRRAIQQQMTDAHNELKSLTGRSSQLANMVGGGGGGLLGRGRGGKSFWDMRKIMYALAVVLFVIFIFILPSLLPNSNWGQMINGALSSIGPAIDSFKSFVVNGVDYAINWVKFQFTPCEVAGTGVPCVNVLAQARSCEPFCLSASGHEQAWKGFQIKRLEIVPNTIFDYQRFSVLAEFANEGSGDVEFLVPREPAFGFFKQGTKLKCEFGIEGWIFWEPPCQNIFPIRQQQSSITKYASGTCARGGTGFPSSCKLEPGDVVQLRWVGFDIEPDTIRKGVTVKPGITISLPYTFIVPNDLVGTMAVQTVSEQLATATVEKKENRIINKVNQVYSPPGPLMMAMGTADRQVIAGTPTLFVVQFGNKGSGVVTDLSKNNIMLYLPPSPDGFEPARGEDGEEICDFEKVADNVNALPADTRAQWNPGPGFENYVLYRPKNDTPQIAQTRNPLETPTLTCLLRTPETVDKVKTYDLKMRVKQYEYTEEKKSSISLTGTSISGALRGGTQVKSFSLGGVSKCAGAPGWCSNVQNVAFKDDAGNYKGYFVKKITATAYHGGNKDACTAARVRFTYYDWAGNSFVMTQGADKTATDPIRPQDHKSLTQDFASNQIKKLSSVTATISSHEWEAFHFECPYIDDLKVVITYLPGHKVDVKTSGGTVTSTPGIINCRSGSIGRCSDEFLEGSTVTLTAQPATATQEITWGGDCAGRATTDVTCELTMDKAKTVTVFFKAP